MHPRSHIQTHASLRKLVSYTLACLTLPPWVLCGSLGATVTLSIVLWPIVAIFRHWLTRLMLSSLREALITYGADFSHMLQKIREGEQRAEDEIFQEDDNGMDCK